MFIKTKKVVRKLHNIDTKQRSQRFEQVMELINKIEKAENLFSLENQKRIGEKLQILPGNQTGVVTSLSLR